VLGANRRVIQNFLPLILQRKLGFQRHDAKTLHEPLEGSATAINPWARRAGGGPRFQLVRLRRGPLT